VASLAREMVNNYSLYKHKEKPRILAASTIEELEKGRKMIASDSAIILTDVISSGSLCKQVKAALPEVNWLGTLALLDTRDLAADENVTEDTIQVYPDCNLSISRDSRLGVVYPLLRKRVEKFHPDKVGSAHVIPIDSVNICPAEYPDLLSTRKREIWPFLENNKQALKVGHFEAGNYHHYTYYVNALQLLDAVDPSDGQSVADVLVQTVISDLDRIGYDPDKTVLIHLPRETSYAEEIAKKVQRHTGILHRLILYRDSFAGHWQFSPFVQRGKRFKGYIAVLIDDGSNTGETLMGLLDAAAFSQPAQILAYFGVTRMPLYKVDLFSRLASMTGVSGHTKIQFMVSFNVPVYSPRTCPICRLSRGLTEVSIASPLFARFADVMKNEIQAIETRSDTSAEESRFLWKYTTPLKVARLREEIELVGYPSLSAPIADEILTNVSTDREYGKKDDDALLDLAFVLSAEPELISSTKFAPYLNELLITTLERIETCYDHNLMTYVFGK
jgi:hypothetical protein